MAELIESKHTVPNIVISKPNVFPGYLLIMPWFVRNTYFLPIFQNLLAKLHESGIERKIHYYALAVNRFKHLNKLFEILEKQFPSQILDREQMKAKLHFWFLYGTEFKTKNIENTVTPLTVDMLKVVIVVYSSLLLTAIVILVCEKFKHFVKSHLHG